MPTLRKETTLPALREFAVREAAPSYLLNVTIECDGMTEALTTITQIRSMLAAPTAHANAVDAARSEFAEAVKRTSAVSATLDKLASAKPKGAPLIDAATEVICTMLQATAPHVDQATSRAAAQRIAPYLTKRRLEVYRLILQAGENGVEDTEGADALGFDASRQYSPRRKELVDAGLVVDSGRTRKTPRGQDAVVWAVNPRPDPERVELAMQAPVEDSPVDAAPENPSVVRAEISENRGSPPKLSEPETPRPGIDPARVLAIYDAQSAGTVAPAPTDGADFQVGQRYDGIEIVRVQVSKAQGFGVLTLNDGSRVQYDLATGHEIARKNQPPAPEGVDTRNVEIHATTRQGGPGAPKVDQPLVDAHTPEGSLPDWMVHVVEAESLKDAVVAALKRIAVDDFVDWADANRARVPAFQRVQSARFRARIERQLVLLTPAKESSQ